MARIRLDGDVLTVPEGFMKRSSFSLDSLRLVYLIAATSGRWYVVASSQGMSYVDLDGLDRETWSGLADEVSAAIHGKGGASGVWFALADYEGASALIPLATLKRAGLDLIPALATTREARAQRRDAWLAGSPVVNLKGNLGASATLDRTGFRRGKKFIAWGDVGTVQTETNNGIRTDLLLLPHGSGGGIFNLRRFRYSLSWVPNRKKELYAAECYFWLQRAERPAATKTIGQALSQ